MDEAFCEICGQAFTKKRNDQKYCAVCKDRIKREYKAWANKPCREKLLYCIVCGKEIKRKRSQNTCSVRCANILSSIASGIRAEQCKKQNKKKRRVKKVKPMSKLGQRIAEAKALGMDYGEYMAMRYMKGE